MNRDFLKVGIIGGHCTGSAIARRLVNNDNVVVVDLREGMGDEAKHICAAYNYPMELLNLTIASPPLWKVEGWPVYETQKAIRNRGRKRIRNVMKSAKNYWLWEALYFPKTN